MQWVAHGQWRCARDHWEIKDAMWLHHTPRATGCPMDVPFLVCTAQYCIPQWLRVTSAWEAVHPSEVLCGIFPFVLTFPSAEVKSAWPCASWLLLVIQWVGLSLWKGRRGMTGWKKPAPESLCNPMFMLVYIWAGSGAAWVGHCQSVLVRSELESHWSCTPSLAPSACGCPEISWAVMRTNKSHKSTWSWCVGTHPHYYVADNFAFLPIFIKLDLTSIMDDSRFHIMLPLTQNCSVSGSFR